MKKAYLSISLAGFSLCASASTGSANDGFVFSLALVAVLLLIAGVIQAAGWLGKNGGKAIRSVASQIRKLPGTINNVYTRLKRQGQSESHSDSLIQAAGH